MLKSNYVRKENWQVNTETGVYENVVADADDDQMAEDVELDENGVRIEAVQKRVWQRDIVAAKCMLIIKGKY